MTDAEILRMKLNLVDCALDDKGKEDFLSKTDNFHDVFSLMDLVFQDDLIKCKYSFDVIMDDAFIHSTAEEHMDDLMDLFKVL